nr:hypothetical protein [uncultured Sphingomonas sp.]
MPRPRPRHSFTEHELAHFCATLARTGNMTLAAEGIHRPVRSLHNRRKLDPVFAARCNQALAEYRAADLTPVQTPRARRNDLRAAGGEWVVTRCKNRRAQLRRARPGQMTEAALDAFLAALAASANLSFAARSIGVTTHAITYRRKRCTAFDNMVREALEIGIECLQGQLLDTALRSVEDRIAGHDVEPPAIERMSAPDALSLLARQERHLSNPPFWSAEQRAKQTSDAAARLRRLLQRLRLEQGLPPDA